MADSPENYAGTFSRSPSPSSSPSSTAQDERRNVQRFVINADSEVEEPKAKAKVNGRMTDIGLGGCYVDAMTTFPVGTHVIVRMMREDLPFEAGAKVVFASPGLGMGLAFSNLGPEQQRQLSQWIAELSGTAIEAPKPAKVPASQLRELMGRGGERGALVQLITLLTRKGMLTESEFEQLVRQLEKTSNGK